MILWNLALIFALIALNGFFVAVEFAAVASRRSRLDLLADANSRSVKLVKNWLEDTTARERLIAASQLGVTTVSLALGAVGENTFQELLNPIFNGASLPTWLQAFASVLPALPLVLSLVIVTSLTVVFGEQVPKVATLRGPERFALKAAPVMDVYSKVFKGFIHLLDGSTRLVLKLAGIPPGSTNTVYSLEELKQIVAGPEAEGVIEQPEREMLSAIFNFGELVVRQVSLPRMEIVGIEADAPLEEVVTLVAEHSLTKYPVFEDNLDQIIGILHVHDLFSAWLDPQRKESTARALARETLFVPETISVNDLLLQFRASHQHIAIVLDEFGGTAGLVTLEDLVEEIVGVFRDPFENTPDSIQVLPDGSALIDGLTPFEEINEHFGLHLEDPNYDTIAGFVLGRLGRIPKVGDSLEVPEDKVRLKVEAMDRLRIARLHLTQME